MKISTVDEAAKALNYFNHLHDGFIKRMTVESHDTFDFDGDHILTGELEVTILFVHYNYERHKPSPKRHVEASFTAVKSLLADFPGRSFEWSIYEVVILEGARAGENGHGEKCMRMIVRSSAAMSNDASALSFTFREGLFRELETT